MNLASLIAETVSGPKWRYLFNLLVTNTTKNMHVCVYVHVHMYLKLYMNDH